MIKTSMTCCTLSNNTEHGFTLIEIAVVLLIVGLMLGSILGPISKQRENRNIQETENQLQEIHDALIGFAALNGYLPCPAVINSSGQESRAAGLGSDCTNEHGYIPSNTLGLRGKFNDNQLLTDAWGGAIRYSLNNVATWEYAKAITLQSTPATFAICATAGCAAGTVVASNIIATIYSLGSDQNTSPTSIDQLDNLDGDDQFVSRTPTDGIGTEFDDILSWISPNTLALHLIKSGQLSN